MNVLDAVVLARELVEATDASVLTARFLGEACASAGAPDGFCYWRNATGDRIEPIACVAHNAATLPAISLEEMDNPLIYSLLSGKATHVERMSSLVGMGPGYERLRGDHTTNHALLVLPLSDPQRRTQGVMALVGGDRLLRAWRDDSVWQAFARLHELLLIRLQSQQVAGDGARQINEAGQRRDIDQGRSRAARLLAAGFIGEGRIALRLREQMLRAADSSLALLITGETGSGKDHAAWLIHQASPREGKFVAVNCAAIPKDLIEAELFGAARGAYTGATQARAGLVAEAHGGTLFLDEIGDMPMALQGTLLRLLNEKRFRPVGATREQSSDFRLMCATHRPLPELVREGAFREDLFFRIRQQVLNIPPLRERPEDINALVTHILLQYNRESKSRVTGISPGGLSRLKRHAFPGNVRELRSLVLAAAERTPPGKPIDDDVLAEVEESLPRPMAHLHSYAILDDLLHTRDLPAAVKAFERLLINERLRQIGGSKREAAMSLGLPQRTFARKCMDLNGEDF